DVCQRVTVTCSPLVGNSFGANSVSCTATDAAGNQSTTTLTVNVIEPLRIAFLSPLADDNVADDINTDADATNVFQVKSTIPHKVKLYACSGADVTAARAVTVRLTVSLRTGDVGSGINIIPTYTGAGDA